MSEELEKIKSRIVSRLCVVNKYNSPDSFDFRIFRSTEINEKYNNYEYNVKIYIPYENNDFPYIVESNVTGDTEEQALKKVEEDYVRSCRWYAQKTLSAILCDEVELEDIEFVINALKLRLGQKKSNFSE